MRRLMLLIMIAAAALTGCGWQVTPKSGIRCISYTDSEIYPLYHMTCWCEVEEGGEWVECDPPEVLQ